MQTTFFSVGPTGGVATMGGSNSAYESVRINHESVGTYHITWDQMDVTPVVVVSAQHGSEQSIVGTAGYVTQESMYIYTRDLSGNLVDEQFCFVMYS